MELTTRRLGYERYISREVGWAVFHAAGFMAVTPPLYIAIGFVGIALLLFTSGLVANMYECFFTNNKVVPAPVVPSHGVAGASGVAAKVALVRATSKVDPTALASAPAVKGGVALDSTGYGASVPLKL